jgi:hypothetical protein
METPRLDLERAAADLRFCHEQFESIRNDVMDLGGTLTPPQIAWRPDASTWSVAQCIEHLIVTITCDLRHIRGLLALARAARIQRRAPHAGVWLAESPRVVALHDAPRPSLAVAATASVAPPDAEPETVFSRFLALNEELLDVVDEATSIAASGTPTAIDLLDTVGHALQLNALHHWRFVLQARRVTERPGFPRREQKRAL